MFDRPLCCASTGIESAIAHCLIPGCRIAGTLLCRNSGSPPTATLIAALIIPGPSFRILPTAGFASFIFISSDPNGRKRSNGSRSTSLRPASSRSRARAVPRHTRGDRCPTLRSLRPDGRVRIQSQPVRRLWMPGSRRRNRPVHAYWRVTVGSGRSHSRPMNWPYSSTLTMRRLLLLGSRTARRGVL